MMLGCWAAAMLSGTEPAEIYRAGLSGCHHSGDALISGSGVTTAHRQ